MFSLSVEQSSVFFPVIEVLKRREAQRRLLFVFTLYSWTWEVSVCTGHSGEARYDSG